MVGTGPFGSCALDLVITLLIFPSFQNKISSLFNSLNIYYLPILAKLVCGYRTLRIFVYRSVQKRKEMDSPFLYRFFASTEAQEYMFFIYYFFY